MGKHVKDHPKIRTIKFRADNRCWQQLKELSENSDDGNGNKMGMSEIIRDLIENAHNFHNGHKS